MKKDIKKQATKIASFFNRLPYYALFPKEAEQDKQEIIEKLINKKIKIADIMPEIEKAATWAESLDIPPFVSHMDRTCFLKNPCMTHLLSGQQYRFDLPDSVSIESVRKHLRNQIDDINKSLPESNEHLFLALWRYLPEKLAQNDPCGINQHWHVLPADPCIPSHTIWEHASIASAIAGALPNPNLLIFTLASAQEIVATSRRTQDAWMGSFLLSCLSWEAIKVIVEACGPDALIFPSLRNQPVMDYWLYHEKKFTDLKDTIHHPDFKHALEVGNIPNIFTAIVPEENAQQLAKEAEKAVEKKWLEITNEVKNKCESTVSEVWKIDLSSWDDIWNRQRNGFISDMGIFWSICPWGNDLDKVIQVVSNNEYNSAQPFEEIIDNLQQQKYSTHIGMGFHMLSGFAAKGLTARKNLRNFSNLPDDKQDSGKLKKLFNKLNPLSPQQTTRITNIPEPGHRCSLCGKWEAVHPDYLCLKEVKEVNNHITNVQIKDNPQNESNSYQWLRAFWSGFSQIARKDKNTLKLKGRIRKGERLCTICLTRRLAMEAYFEDKLELDHHQFLSTAGICTARYRDKIINAYLNNTNEWKEKLDDFNQKLKEFIVEDNQLPFPAATVAYFKTIIKDNKLLNKFLQIDGDWLFENTYDPKSLKKTYDIKEEKKLAACLNSLIELKKVAQKNNIKKPSPYYAIIAMDGDKMSDWLKGATAPLYEWLFHPDVERHLIEKIVPIDYNRPMGPAIQLGLSDSLKNFALYRVRDIVEKENPGKLIYAGGDDVLAFVPLEYLLDIMKALYVNFVGDPQTGFMNHQQKMMRMMGGVRSNGDDLAKDHQGMTVSMGILILHHSYPLYHALHQVQKVLKDVAKETLGRNAFAIRLMRRSGEYSETGFKFFTNTDDHKVCILDAMKEILQLYTDDKLSSRLPYRMTDNLWASMSDQTVPENIHNARRIELKRLVIQHTKHKDFTSETIHKVCSLFDTIHSHLTDPQKDRLSIDSWDIVSQILMILRFMAGKGESVCG